MNEKKDVVDWFIHDSNNSLVHIQNNIENYLEGEKPDKRKLKQALLHCQEALYLNQLLRTGEHAYSFQSVYKNILLWSEYKNYPKVEVILTGKESPIRRFNDIRHLIMILAELSKNAYKANATEMKIEIKGSDSCSTKELEGKEIFISNNGKPIENADKIFEQGYSTFGTSGNGLTIINKLCEWSRFKLTLESANPVIFKLAL